MKIGIDGNEANIRNKVGVHQYAFEILNALYNARRSETNANKKHSYIIFLKNKPRKELPKETTWWKYTILSGGRVWVLTRLTPHLLLHNNIDVLFVPSHYAPIYLKIPIVITVHDLGYLESSEQFKKYDFWQLKYWTANSIRVSQRIISVSQSTKDDLVRHYPTSRLKIKTVHHGYDKKRFNINISEKLLGKTLKKYEIPNDYILFLSVLKPSKNIEGLIEAFSLTQKNKAFRKYKLVIAGRKGWLYDPIFAKVKMLGIEQSVVFTDFVPEEDKPILYYGAKLFCLPAFWEGFGMTALEAMACGTPPVVSRVGGLPEVVGDAGIFVNQDDPESIASGMCKVLLAKESDYAKLQSKSLIQAKKFSWEKAAKETLKVIESVVK